MVAGKAADSAALVLVAGTWGSPEDCGGRAGQSGSGRPQHTACASVPEKHSAGRERTQFKGHTNDSGSTADAHLICHSPVHSNAKELC